MYKLTCLWMALCVVFFAGGYLLGRFVRGAS
jgi:hypothetical protein